MIIIKVKNLKTNSRLQRQLYAKCQSFIQLIGAILEMSVRLWHIRRAIARARLHTRLKLQRYAIQHTPYVIETSFRRAPFRTSPCQWFFFSNSNIRIEEQKYIISLCNIITDGFFYSFVLLFPL